MHMVSQHESRYKEHFSALSSPTLHVCGSKRLDEVGVGWGVGEWGGKRLQTPRGVCVEKRNTHSSAPLT